MFSKFNVLLCFSIFYVNKLFYKVQLINPMVSLGFSLYQDILYSGSITKLYIVISIYTDQIGKNTAIVILGKSPRPTLN